MYMYENSTQGLRILQSHFDQNTLHYRITGDIGPQ